MIKMKKTGSCHSFGLAPQSRVHTMADGKREFTAEMFDVSSAGEFSFTKAGGEVIATLVKPGENTGQELTKAGGKVFKDSENFTKKEIANFVIKGEK